MSNNIKIIIDDTDKQILELSKDDILALQFISAMNQQDIFTSIVQSIRNEKLFNEIEREGGNILMEKRGKLRYLTRSH